jgi:uncharacterized protein involved in exopolysaccharide biosynthesis
VIGVEFSSEDATLAAQVPNALIDAYLAFQSGAKLESNTDASAWLEPEITKLREKVRESEEKVAQYRAEKGCCWSINRTRLPQSSSPISPPS